MDECARSIAEYVLRKFPQDGDQDYELHQHRLKELTNSIAARLALWCAVCPRNRKSDDAVVS